MAFSPDGGRIAGVTLGNVVKIWSADGSDQTVATLPKTVRDLSWSSDGSSLAALTGDFGNLDHSIYVIPLATGVPAHVYTDASVNRINLENGLSWQPGGNQILFTSNLPDIPASNDSFTQQLFTVPASGGAATQFFVPPSNPGDPLYRFGTPEWAPDGTRIAVWVQENGTVPSPYQDTYIGVMTAGVGPIELRTVHVIPPAAAGPYWSTDGTALLFSDVPARSRPGAGHRHRRDRPRGAGELRVRRPDHRLAAVPDRDLRGLGAAHGTHAVAPGLQEEGDQGQEGDVHGRGRRRGCVGLHGRPGGRPAEGGDRSPRNLPSPGRGHDRRGRSVQGEGQGPQHGPLPGRGHRAAGLPDRDVPAVKVRVKAPKPPK